MFNFKIVYQPNEINWKADALTRQLVNIFTHEDDQIFQQSCVVLKPKNFLEVYTFNISMIPAYNKPISKPALSEIQNNNFQDLKSNLLQFRSQLFLSKEEALLDKNKNLDIDQLWQLA